LCRPGGATSIFDRAAHDPRTQSLLSLARSWFPTNLTLIFANPNPPSANSTIAPSEPRHVVAATVDLTKRPPNRLFAARGRVDNAHSRASLSFRRHRLPLGLPKRPFASSRWGRRTTRDRVLLNHYPRRPPSINATTAAAHSGYLCRPPTRIDGRATLV